MNLADKRRQNQIQPGLDATGLYHSFELPDGRILHGANTLEWQRERLASFGLPEDLRGRTVLDIGPWDGFYTFEMERRGATVTAVDYVDLDSFRVLHRAFGSKARYERMDVYELDAARIGTFDIVLCLGALYHFKHPLLALEKVCAVTRELCIVDTFVVDGNERREGVKPPMPYLEFYEAGELGGMLDNWCGPTVCAVEAMARAAGFARTEVLRVTDASACIAAHRRWRDLPPPDEGATGLIGLSSHADRGRSFESSKEQYLAMFCEWSREEPPALCHVYPEVDGFGVAPIACACVVEGLQIMLRIPPGLASGRHEARIRIGRADWSRTADFYMDLPPLPTACSISSIQDGATWKSGVVAWPQGGWLTAWVDGLSAEADAGNTVVEIGGVPHWPQAVTGGQVNVRLRGVIGEGRHAVAIVHRGVRSAAVAVDVIGRPAPVRGLETL